MLSVGAFLSRERTKKGLTLKQVEKETRIREKFLKALEDDNWDFFSSKIYVSGLINNYSKFLGLNTEKMQMFFRRDYERKEEVKFKKHISKEYLNPETKKIAIGALITIILLFFTYFIFQLKIYLSPPTITIISPRETTFKNIDKVDIIGRTDKDATITIFGERIFENQDGVFQYTFPLKKGKNTLTVEVIGANGKKSTLDKTFTVTE